jgi:hypothetical protein
MFGTLILAVAIVAIGSTIGDTLRLKQEETILRKLPVAEAADYYQALVRRARRTRWLRAATLTSAFVLLYLARRLFLSGGR